MSRDLSPEIQKAKNARNSARFCDWAIIVVPPKRSAVIGLGIATEEGSELIADQPPVVSAPLVIRVARAAITMPTPDGFATFTFVAFLGSLGRAPTPDEQSDWETALEALSGDALAAEARTRVTGLFTSSAYTARARSDYEFISDLYSAFLGRDPDAEGRDAWTAYLADHTRDDTAAAFSLAEEFRTRVLSVGSPVEFEHDITDMTAISFSEGRAVDGVDITLTNAGNTYSRELGKGDRVLYPVRAVVGRGFFSNGEYKPDQVVVGSARFTSTSGKEVKLTVTSDTSRVGASVVEPVTQRCLNIYKGPGCDSPDTSPTCSRLFFDAVNGCAAKAPAPILIGATNNQPSFRGAPPPPDSTPATTTTTTNSGFGEGNVIDPRNTNISKYQMLNY